MLIERTNRQLARVAAWLMLAMVLVQFVIVAGRYVFGLNSLIMQETVIIVHGLVFMLAAAQVLQDDKHVRVDIFYAGASKRKQGAINLAGTIFLLLPFAVIVLWHSMPYVVQSWKILEGSPDMDGLHLRYLQKTAILVFAATLGLQGLAMIVRALRAIRSR